MKKFCPIILLIVASCSSAFADQTWIFQLSSGMPAAITISGSLPDCKGLDPHNHAGSIKLGINQVVTADLCLDQATKVPSVQGLYAFSNTQASSFHILTGSSMEAEIDQIFSSGYNRLGNGVNGACPSNAAALLSINGNHLGDTDGVGGYCLYSN